VAESIRDSGSGGPLEIARGRDANGVAGIFPPDRKKIKKMS
jgi:hypothetical protein